MEEIFVETACAGASRNGRGLSLRRYKTGFKSGRHSSSSARRVKLGLAIFYAIAIPTFIVVGLQPADTAAEVKASEIASAEEYLSIRSIGLETPVDRVYLKNNTLNAPEYIAGAYHAHANKTLVIGHSLTIFENLDRIRVGDQIDYEDGTYVVTSLETREKSAISMNEILKDEDEPTLILMTCAGERLSGVDFSHRLIVRAEKV